MVDIELPALLAGVVLVASLSTSLFIFGRGKNTTKPETSVPVLQTQNQEAPKINETKIEELKKRANSSPSRRIIPRAQLEKSKKELKTLLLEKELVSAALTRLYEAEAAGDISKEEREVLGAKYRDELRALDSKVVRMDAFIEVGDLETLREQLLQLVSEKIEAIEKRIERTQRAAEPLIKEILEKNALATHAAKTPVSSTETKSKPQVPDISDLLASKAKSTLPTESTAATSSSSVQGAPQEVALTESISVPEANTRPQSTRRRATSDGQVEELQKELLEALDRLEKLDVEA